jgi:hypothetical protein
MALSTAGATTLIVGSPTPAAVEERQAGLGRQVS